MSPMGDIKDKVTLVYREEKRDLREIRDDIRTTRRGRFAWWLITVAARAVDLEIDDYIDNHGKGP